MKLSKKEEKGFDRLIANYIRELFDERQVSQKNRQMLWDRYNNRLSKAVDIGYNQKILQYDPELAHSLKYNIAKFSAFKETSFKNQLEDMLTKNGKIVPWSEFKKQAFAVSEDYNKRWLKTEYHQTVATANMAGKWKDFERNKDLYPNIKYVTVGDDRVRKKHAQWDGLILPMEHDFWTKNLPPNDWGCRCTVVQTDEEVTQDIPSAQPKDGFANNPAMTGEVFTNTTYEKGMSEAAKAEAHANLSNFLLSENRLIKTKNPRVLISLGADLNDLKRNYELANIVSSEIKFDFVIRTHVYLKGVKNPEYLIANQFLGDRKSILGVANMRKVIDDSKKQMFHPSINPDKIPYYIVWDLDGVEALDINGTIRTLQRKVNRERGTSIKGMIFQYKGKAILLTREEIVARKFDKLNLLK